MPVEEVLRIALDVADALTRAHRLKIIHRDIKPHNVLIDGDGTPLLTDFGVAHLDDRSRLTQSGSMVGTYAYLSPEGCHGEDLDERTDIWSFGVMLFEMLTGERPFTGATPGAVLTAILSKPIPDLAQLRPDLPPRLITLINAMLEKDRNLRTSSVRMVGAELESIMRGEPLPNPDSPGITRVLEPAESSRFNTPHTPNNQTPVAALSPTPTQILEDSVRQHDQAATPATPPPPLRMPMIIGALVLLFGLVGGGFMFLGPKPDAPATTPTNAALSPTTTPTPEAPSGPPVVQPVAAGEYMVLVAHLEPLGSGADPFRFLLDNLTQAFEHEVPFTRVKVREYPQVITSAAQAQAAAADNQAPIIVWGNYDDSGVELNIELGVTNTFSNIKIERSILERTANVRVRMSDVRNESAAMPVLVILNVLRIADGNGYELMRTVASLEELKMAPAQVTGNSIAARVNRFFLNYFSNTEEAIKEIDAAINLEPNPILYTYRGAARFRVGLVEESLNDMETARRIGPADWTSPLFFIGGTEPIIGQTDPATLEQSLTIFNQIVAQQPDDWFALSSRGFLQYVRNDLPAARADMESAMRLDPDINTPYMAATMIALREGRINDAANLMFEAIMLFPNQAFGERVFTAFYGTKVPNILGPFNAAFGSLMMGQYSETITYADTILGIDDRLVDAYFLRGFAQCNLDQYAAAEASYTQGIERDPGFSLLYLLRAETRMAQQNPAGAQEDLALAAQSSQAEDLGSYLSDAQAGTLSCKTIFAPK